MARPVAAAILWDSTWGDSIPPPMPQVGEPASEAFVAAWFRGDVRKDGYLLDMGLDGKFYLLRR